MQLNALAAERCRGMVESAEILRIALGERGGARVVDCGVAAAGGLEAGRRLAEVCMAGLGTVEFLARSAYPGTMLAVAVRTDHPLAACMAAQYAGRRISRGKFFAMGSGPMRALARKEPLFEELKLGETADVAVGVLESASLPPPEVCRELARECGVEPEGLWLLVARTASQAGGVQVVARSVEVAMHKLHELGFDLRRVESGCGAAPLPPVAGDDLAAMGRTNDAILYGGEVTLWVRGDDDSLAAIGPRLPSGASRDYGVPFVEIFRRYRGDFYAIDPLLFGPASVTLANLDTGRSWRFGRTAPELLARSFGTEQAGAGG